MRIFKVYGTKSRGKLKLVTILKVKDEIAAIHKASVLCKEYTDIRHILF